MVDLRERDYYGGGSIRLVLSSILDTKSILEKALNKCNNYKRYSEGLSGQAAASTVNTLFQCLRKGTYVPVSQYVSRCLAFKLGDDFVKLARQQMSDNPVFQGWIFELEILNSIEKRTVSNWVPNDHPWNIYNLSKEFHDVDDLPSEIADNTLLIPVKYNQGLFDVMLYESKGHVRVANVTMAKVHLFKLEHIIPFASRFKDENNKCQIVMDVIIPLENRKKYHVSSCNFIDKSKLSKYDNKWYTGAAPSTLCNVYLVSRNGDVPQNAPEQFQFPVTDTTCSIPDPFSMVLRKRTRFEDEWEDVQDDSVVDFY